MFFFCIGEYMINLLGKDMTYLQVIAQIIGIIGVIEYSFVTHQKTKIRVLIIQIIGACLYGTQYILLGGWSALITCLLNILRDIVFYQFEKKNKDIPKSYFIIFVILAIAINIFTFNGIISLIPLFVVICSTWAIWQKNLKKYRYMALFTNFIWAIYNFSYMAYVSFIGNVIQFISACIAIIRFNFINMGK